MGAIEITWLGGPEVEALALGDDEILGAVEAGLAAQGRGEMIHPRMHLTPWEKTKEVEGHFNVLRGCIHPLGLAGVKVVSDFAGRRTCRRLMPTMACGITKRHDVP